MNMQLVNPGRLIQKGRNVWGDAVLLRDQLANLLQIAYIQGEKQELLYLYN